MNSDRVRSNRKSANAREIGGQRDVGGWGGRKIGMVCVCGVCVCVSESEKVRESQRKRREEREEESESDGTF